MTVGRPKETAKTTLKSEPLGEPLEKRTLGGSGHAFWTPLDFQTSNKRAPVEIGPTKSDIENN